MIIATPGQRSIAPIGENDFVSTDSLGLLLPGESIVWSGEPMRHRLLRLGDVYLIPFSLVWGGFAIFWEAGAVTATFSNPLLVVAGLPFLAAGLFLIFGRFILRGMASRRARYLVTDRRVVVTGGVTGRAVGTAYLVNLPPPVVKHRNDGCGDLAFGAFPGYFDYFGRRNTIVGTEPIIPFRFRDIPDVLHVRDLIVASQSAARTNQLHSG